MQILEQVAAGGDGYLRVHEASNVLELNNWQLQVSTVPYSAFAFSYTYIYRYPQPVVHNKEVGKAMHFSKCDVGILQLLTKVPSHFPSSGISFLFGAVN